MAANNIPKTSNSVTLKYINQINNPCDKQVIMQWKIKTAGIDLTNLSQYIQWQAKLKYLYFLF